jgi:hypothetical protein
VDENKEFADTIINLKKKKNTEALDVGKGNGEP